MNTTTVHDCAATGIYIGDLFSNAYIERSNIIRNGGGTRPPLAILSNTLENGVTTIAPARIHENFEHSDTDDHTDEFLDHIDLPMHHHDNDDHHLVPPGHSGMYLETSTAIVKDCLLRNNSLTGLSVVRGGKIKISICDIFDNGSDPVTIEDAHDVLLGLGDGIRGGVEDLGGNCYSQHGRENYEGRDAGISSDRNNERLVRQTMFSSTAYNHSTVASLQVFHSFV
jgi:hypothetical protein